MTPVQAIAQLDRQIAAHGQDVTLRRIVANAAAIDRTHRAFARGYRPDELAGGIQQNDSLVILSPTGMPAPFVAEPLRVNDKILYDGRMRNVAYVETVRVQGVPVRYNATVRG